MLAITNTPTLNLASCELSNPRTGLLKSRETIWGKYWTQSSREWKEKGLEDNPFDDLLVQAANDYADDDKFDSLVERGITEIPLCTCSVRDDLFGGSQTEDTRVIGLNYRGFDPLLHEEQCPLRTGSPLII